MIGRLRGRLAEKGPNRLVIDVQGVGYDVHVPLSTFYELGEPGTEVTLRVYTHVREDLIALFGFATALEQQIFERLIGISGVGPRLAIAVLSGIDPHELVEAVGHGDVARLTAIPGIGKKTAERISLELKDRLPLVLLPPPAHGAAADGNARLRDDVLSALQNLGYHRPFAERAIDAAIKAGEVDFERALKYALQTLSGRGERR